MQKLERVLICIDFSDYSEQLLADAIAFIPDATQVYLISVVNSRDITAVRSASNYFPGDNFLDHYIERSLQSREEDLRKLAAKRGGGKQENFRLIVKVGVPFEEILDAVEEEKIDLVVMGDRGRSNLAKTLAGSNAEKVFRHSPVPVLSIRRR